VKDENTFARGDVMVDSFFKTEVAMEGVAPR
jgi:hypothetical protein